MESRFLHHISLISYPRKQISTYVSMEHLQVVALFLLLAAVHAGDLTGYTDSYATPQASYGVPNGGSYNTGYNNGYNGGYNNGNGYGGSHTSYDEQPKAYQFGYAVKDYATGNDYNRHETSDGNTITGEYRVQLPDGRTQIVSYVADWKNGFRAQVRYEGEARYPSGPSNYGSADAGYGSPASGYGAPAAGYGAPAAGYGAPAAGYGTPSNGYGTPANGYGVPSPYTSATFNNGGYGGSQHHGGNAATSSYGSSAYRK